MKGEISIQSNEKKILNKMSQILKSYWEKKIKEANLTQGCLVLSMVTAGVKVPIFLVSATCYKVKIR